MLAELLRFALPAGGLAVLLFIVQDLRETKQLLTAEVGRLQLIVEEERARYERMEQALARIAANDELRMRSEMLYRDNLAEIKAVEPEAGSVLDIVVPDKFLYGLRAYSDTDSTAPAERARAPVNPDSSSRSAQK